MLLACITAQVSGKTSGIRIPMVPQLEPEANAVAADRMKLGEDKRPLAALGYLTLGRRFLNNRHDIIDDLIDVVTRGMMGLTVQCARCHDHKYLSLIHI